MLHQTPEEAARQRKQNRIYICKHFEILSHLKKLKGNKEKVTMSKRLSYIEVSKKLQDR
jgi:hypothetical protein